MLHVAALTKIMQCRLLHLYLWHLFTVIAKQIMMSHYTNCCSAFLEKETDSPSWNWESASLLLLGIVPRCCLMYFLKRVIYCGFCEKFSWCYCSAVLFFSFFISNSKYWTVSDIAKNYIPYSITTNFCNQLM